MKNLRNINLLKKKKEELAGISKFGRYALYAAAISLILFIMAYIFTFSLLSYLSYKTKSMDEKIASLTSEIEQKKDIEALVITNSAKISSIEDIITHNLPYPSFLADIFESGRVGIVFRSFTISPSSAASIELSASSSSSLSDFVQLLVGKDEIENKYKNIRTTSIARDKDGGYILGVNFGLEGKSFHEE